MGNYVQRPLPQRNQMSNSYRDASVAHSKSASSNSGRRDRNVRHEPDLREHLNQNRGFEAPQPDLRDRLTEQRDQAHPQGYPSVATAMPIVLAMPAFPANNPYGMAIAQLTAQIRAVDANQAQARVERVYADNSSEELKPFAPHISNTTFPPGIKLPHLTSYDFTTDPGSHLSTFNIVMRASNVNTELRCMLFPTTLTGPAKS